MREKPKLTAFICVCFALLLAIACNSNDALETAEVAPIRDEDGATLTSDELLARLSAGGWVAEPVHGEDGSVAEILVSRQQASQIYDQSGSEPPPGALMIDGSVPIRDEDGRELTMDEFMEKMSGGGLRPEPRLDDDGEVVEIVLVRDDKVLPSGALGEASFLSPSALNERWQGEPLPDLDLTTLEGKKISITELEGQAVVLNFWFRACKPCLMEIPELNELVEAFEGQDIVFLALTFDSEEEARAVLADQPFDYEVVADAGNILEKFGVESYPTHLVFDRNHLCTTAMSGYTPGIDKKLKMEIRSALEEPN